MEETTTIPETPEEAKAPTIPSEEKLLSAIAYLSVAFIIPMITKPSSKFCQFHTKQGLGMFAVSIAVLFILAIIPPVGSIFFLIFIALSAIAIFQAYQGIEWEIPVLGALVKNIDLSRLIASGSEADAPTEEEEAAAVAEPTEEEPAREPEIAPIAGQTAPAAVEAPVEPEAPSEVEATPIIEPTQATEPVAPPTIEAAPVQAAPVQAAPVETPIEEAPATEEPPKEEISA
ncbi:MAG: hypothetical protein ABII07_04980 [Patescibacteria group bacterium]